MAMTLGDKIKNLRTNAGFTQETFAEKLNVSRSAIAKWESNKGIPEISNLKLISELFDISLDELFNDQPTISNVNEFCPGYYDIELTGWNDGVYNVLVFGEDSHFLYYQKEEKKKKFFGLIGKKHIVSAKNISLDNTPEDIPQADISYFYNRPVTIEVAHREGFLKGFFDFTNDDYLNVTIDHFTDSKVSLKFGKELPIESITKIEELS